VFADLSVRLGHHFVDGGLLELALTHRSWCAEHPEDPSNERLEFLGDAVVGLAVTGHIYQRYPDLSEGELAKLRASVVNTTSLAAVGADLGIGAALRLGKGEDQSGGRSKESILADSFEALIGAVHLDAGWERAQALVIDLLGPTIEASSDRPGGHDYKTRLQELTAQLSMGAPNYLIDGSGPDHDKRFRATVVVDGEPRGQGSGTSKKRAEQEAARSAWHSLTTSHTQGEPNGQS
jgi:ribonuclease III